MPLAYVRFLGWSLLVLVSLLWSTHAALDLLPKQPVLQQLPIYPRAGQIQRVVPKLVGSTYRSIMSFETADAPDRVLAFYRGELLDDGWLPGAGGGQSDTRLGFTAHGCPAYYVDVQASSPPSGRTHVEIKLTKSLCR